MKNYNDCVFTLKISTCVWGQENVKDHMNPHKIDFELGKSLYQHIVKNVQDTVCYNLIDVLKYVK